MDEQQVDTKAEEAQSKKMTPDEFRALAERAKLLDIHRPIWCPEFHYELYKLCYLIVKEEPTAAGMSANNRKKLIMRLMNKHIEAARNELHARAKAEHEKQQAQKGVEDVKTES